MNATNDWLGISEEELEKNDKEVVFELPEPGIHEVKVEYVCIRKTDSGAEMFHIAFESENENKFNWETCIKSGDEKGNKAYYTDKNGVDRPLPGVIQVKRFLQALGLKPSDIKPITAKVELYGEKQTVKIFKKLSGKKLKIAVQLYENEYNGEITERLDIIGWMNTKGEYKGEAVEEKLAKRIEKKPVRKLRKSKVKKEKEEEEDIDW